MKTRNLYIALLFKERPDLHLTVRYYPKVEERGQFEAELLSRIGTIWGMNRPKPFALDCTVRAKFGPRRNIPVLLVTTPLPEWVEYLRNAMPTQDTYAFRPHVTTDAEGPLTLTVDSIGLCHKSEVLWRWELT